MMSTKTEIRQTMQRTLRNLSGRDERSERIWQNVARLPEFQDAVRLQTVVAVYANLETEVQTTRFFETLGARIAVPYCENGEIELFRLESPNELVTQTFGILEPKLELRLNPKRCVLPNELGLVLAPGLAFDTNGNRLGHGAGYYDRFFKRIDTKRESPVPKFAIAFECQILNIIPTEPHDIRLDGIITEFGILTGQ